MKAAEEFSRFTAFLVHIIPPLSNLILFDSKPWCLLPEELSPAQDHYCHQHRSLDDKFIQCLPTKKLTYDPKVSVGRRLLLPHSRVPCWLLDLDLHHHLWLCKQRPQIRFPIYPLEWNEHIVLQHRTSGLGNRDCRRCTLESMEWFASKKFHPPQPKQPPPACDSLSGQGIGSELVYLG